MFSVILSVIWGLGPKFPRFREACCLLVFGLSSDTTQVAPATAHHNLEGNTKNHEVPLGSFVRAKGMVLTQRTRWNAEVLALVMCILPKHLKILVHFSRQFVAATIAAYDEHDILALLPCWRIPVTTKATIERPMLCNSKVTTFPACLR